MGNMLAGVTRPCLVSLTYGLFHTGKAVGAYRNVNANINMEFKLRQELQASAGHTRFLQFSLSQMLKCHNSSQVPQLT